MRAKALEQLVRVARARLAAAMAAVDQKKVELRRVSTRRSLVRERVRTAREEVQSVDKARDALRQQTTIVEAMRRAELSIATARRRLAMVTAEADDVELELQVLQQDMAELARKLVREHARCEYVETLRRKTNRLRAPSAP